MFFIMNFPTCFIAIKFILAIRTITINKNIKTTIRTFYNYFWIFLFKNFRKEKWFRINNYSFEEKISQNHIIIYRDDKSKENNNINENKNKKKNYNYNDDSFLEKLDRNKFKQYNSDEFRDLLSLSVLQEIKLNFYKLGAILVDILCEQNVNGYKYILIFYFP